MRTLDGIVVRALILAKYLSRPPSPFVFEMARVRVMKRFRLDEELVKERLTRFTWLVNTLHLEEAREYALNDPIVGAYLQEVSSKGVKPYELLKLELLQNVEDVREKITEDEKNPHFLPELVFVDEAQDLSPLDWLVLTKGFEEAKFVIVGDDLQAIFNFRGADYRVFESIRAKEIMILDKSYRLPQEIIEVARAYAKQVIGKAYDFKAVHEDRGAEFYLLSPQDALKFTVELARKGFSVQVLTRTSKIANQIRMLMWTQGVFADDLLGSVSAKLRRFEEFLRLLNKAWTRKSFSKGDVERFLKLADEFLVPESKRRIQALFKLPPGLWQGQLDRLLKIENKDIYPDVLAAYSAYKQMNLKLYVDTMHSAKGTESDWVVIWGDFHRRAPNSDEEARLVYVAVTRTRKGVILVEEVANPFLLPLLDILSSKVEVRTEVSALARAKASP